MIRLKGLRSHEPTSPCLGSPAELGRRLWIKIVQNPFGPPADFCHRSGNQDYSSPLVCGLDASMLTCQVLEVRMSVAEPSPARPFFVVAPSRRRVGTQSITGPPGADWNMALLGEESVWGPLPFVKPCESNQCSHTFHMRVGNHSRETPHC